MSQINFLPPSYLQRKLGRHRVRRQAALLLACAVALAGWYGVSRGDLSELESYARSVEAQAAAAHERTLAMTRLEARQEALRARVRLQRELAPPLEMGAVVAAVSAVIPQALAVTQLTLEGQRPTPALSGGGGGAAAPRAPDRLKVTLIGLAPADTDIADFVGRLSESPLFTNVKMLYSKSTLAGDYLGREFHIEMEVPLDRDYRPATPGQEVAHAG